MNTQLRAGRIIVVSLILAFAALVFFFWPAQPKWRVSAEDPDFIGFDEKKGLVYSVEWAGFREGHVLRVSDLQTGQLCNRVQLIPQDGPFQEFLSWFISPAKTRLLTMTDFSAQLMVFDLASGSLQHCFQCPWGSLDSVGFSQDDRLLAARYNDRVFVWDLATGTRCDEVQFSQPLRAGINVNFRGGGLQISADHHYLATDGDNESLVYDLKQRKVIGRCPFRGIPSFRMIENRLTVTFTALCWMADDTLSNCGPPCCMTVSSEGCRDTVCSNDLVYKVSAEKALTGAKVHLCFLDSTAHREREVLTWFAPDACALSVALRSFAVSETGKFVAIGDKTGLTLWEIPPVAQGH